MALKSRNTFNPRQRRTTRVPWIYGMGKSTALGCCAFSKKPAYLTLLPTPNRYAQDHPGADPYDLETLKDFVRDVAYGIDGAYGDPKAGEKSVLQYWKDFTAGWRRHNSTIPPTTTLSVTNVGALRLSLSPLLQVSRLTVV